MTQRCYGFWIFLLFLVVCQPSQAQQAKPVTPAQIFADYWYQGKGEITRYALEQSRYGQVHGGDAVLIFVTEDFLPVRQVKHEGGPAKDKVSVLHMNAIKNFTTGIYPYALMTSVFTPVAIDAKKSPNGTSLKVSSSSQEWCGNMYLQLNRRKSGFDVSSHSYFQQQADQAFKLDAIWLEDELWTQIRLQPENLPIGPVAMLPGTQAIQMTRIPLRAERALGRLISNDTRATQTYWLEYQSIQRVLAIEFEAQFPHTIVGWSEKFRHKESDRWQSTTAIKTDGLQLDYWNYHNIEDLPLRKKLGLK